MSKGKKKPGLEGQLEKTDEQISKLTEERESIGARIRKGKEQEEERTGTLEQRLTAYLQHRGYHFGTQGLKLEMGDTSGAHTIITINAQDNRYKAEDAVKVIEELLGEDAIRKHEHSSTQRRVQAGVDRTWDPDKLSITDSRGDYVETPYYATLEIDKHVLKVDTQALKTAFGMDEPEKKSGRDGRGGK